MSIVIANIRKDLTNDEWLELATYEGNDHESLQTIHSNFATDGYRIHITGYPPCECGDDKLHTSIQERVIDAAKKQPFLFAINRQFLLDALAGIPEDSDHILFFGGEKSSIVIQGRGDESRVAIVMPLELGGRQAAPKIPTVHETDGE